MAFSPFGNRKMSHGAISDEYGVWLITFVEFLVKNSCTMMALYDGVLLMNCSSTNLVIFSGYSSANASRRLYSSSYSPFFTLEGILSAPHPSNQKKKKTVSAVDFRAGLTGFFGIWLIFEVPFRGLFACHTRKPMSRHKL